MYSSNHKKISLCVFLLILSLSLITRSFAYLATFRFHTLTGISERSITGDENLALRKLISNATINSLFLSYGNPGIPKPPVDTPITAARSRKASASARRSLFNPRATGIEVSICKGQLYKLPSGKTVNSTGVYLDTLKDNSGSDSVITTTKVNVSGIIDINPIVCPGTVVQLHAATALSYSWFPATGLNDPTLQNPVFTADASRTYYLTSGIISQNLVVNGDFEQGYTNFYSDYFPCNSDGCLYGEGFYAVDKDANAYHDSLIGRDHTSGNGNFMMVNGTGQPNTIIIKQIVSVKPNTNYYFSTWISSLATRSAADIQFQINGQTIGQVFTAPNVQNRWENFFITWNSGSATTAVITILNQNTELEGNDFGLDDIFFGEFLFCTDNISITVPVSARATINASICDGASYALPSGTMVNKAGIYEDTLKGKAGCDSLISTVNLAITTPVLKNENVTICTGKYYILPSGKIIDISGVYTDTVKNLNGCDSLITTVTLAVLSPVVTAFSRQICKGQTYTLPSGTIIATAGVYQDTIRNASGCDSLLFTITISIVDPFVSNTIISICSGQLYTMPSGRTVGTSGVYNDTVKNVAGCDSLLSTVILTVVAPLLMDDTAAICPGQSYALPSGALVNTAGIYKDTIKNMAGCDSLVTSLLLSIWHPVFVNTSVSVCFGNSYILPSGKIINTAGIFRDTLKSKIGCDSIITTTTLSIVSPARATITASICQAGFYTLPSGKLVNMAGVYEDTVKNAGGCDSLITLVSLGVFTPSTINISAAICAGKWYVLPSGRNVNISGIYNDTLKNVVGCDSLITVLSLTVFNTSFENVIASICPGQSYILPSGSILKNAGVYQDTVRNFAGCDSIIITLSLSILNPIITSTTAQVCLGSFYILPSGKKVNTAGIYQDTLKSSIGCDSLVTTTFLSVISPGYLNVSTRICQSGSYVLPSGNIVNKAGIYHDTLRSQSGCDSLITTLALNVFNPSLVNLTASICAGDSYTLPSTRKINTSGIFSDTIRSIAGCDSLITTISLTVLTPALISTDISVCPGESFTLPSGTVISSAGIYTDTLRSALTGCDSLITTYNFKINSATSAVVTASICSGQSYTLPSGQIVATPGVYVSLIKNTMGCDSSVTTTINYFPPLSVKLTGPATICSGEHAVFTAQPSGGNGGPYTYSWSTSTSTANPLIFPAFTTTKEIISLSDGCTSVTAKDSIVLVVNPRPVSNFSLTPTEGCAPLTVQFSNGTLPALNNIYTWNFGDAGTGTQTAPSHTYNNPGTYTVSLVSVSANGCADSFKIDNAVKVSLKPVASFRTSPSPNITGNSKITFTDLSLNATSWLWIFGDGMGSSVQRDPSYIYQDTGRFTAMLVAGTQKNCTDTAYAKIIVEGGKEIYIPNAFTPNSDGINDHFGAYAIGLQSAHMVIFDRWGEKVFEQKGNPPQWDGRYQKYRKNCEQGAYVYYIEVVDKTGREHSFRGTVMLLR